MESNSSNKSIVRLQNVAQSFCVKESPSNMDYCILLAELSACIDDCEIPKKLRTKLIKLRVFVSNTYIYSFSATSDLEKFNFVLDKLRKSITTIVLQ